MANKTESKFSLKNFKLDSRNLPILGMALGLLFVLFPVGLLKVVVYAVALVSLLFSAFHFYEYFVNNKNDGEYENRLMIALIFLSIGVYLFVNPSLIISLANLIIGALLLVYSFMQLETALNLMKQKYTYWIYSLVIACITLIFGLVILIGLGNPSTLFTLIGVALLIVGATNIVGEVLLAKSGFDKNKIRKLNPKLDASVFVNTFDGVKKTINEAVELVNEKKEELKEEVNTVKEEISDRAEEMKAAAEKKAEEIKKETVKKAEEIKKEAEEEKKETVKKAEEIKKENEKQAEEAKKEASKKVEKAAEKVEKKAEEVKKDAKDAKKSSK